MGWSHCHAVKYALTADAVTQQIMSNKYQPYDPRDNKLARMEMRLHRDNGGHDSG